MGLSSHSRTAANEALRIRQNHYLDCSKCYEAIEAALGDGAFGSICGFIRGSTLP
jgi:hypothetical protein